MNSSFIKMKAAALKVGCVLKLSDIFQVVTPEARQTVHLICCVSLEFCEIFTLSKCDPFLQLTVHLDVREIIAT